MLPSPVKMTILLLLMSTCYTVVSSYGECVRHVLADDASSSHNSCLYSSNLLETELMPFHQDKISQKILTRDVQEDIINKAVPKCLIVFYNGLMTKLEATLTGE